MHSFSDTPGLAEDLARRNDVSQDIIREFLDLFEEKTRQLRGRFKGRLDLEDIQSEAILWIMEGNLRGYDPREGSVWGYAYPALVNRLAPQASLLKAPMVRKRDTQGTVVAKRDAQSSMASADWDDLTGGDYRYEPLRELLQQEVRDICRVSFAIYVEGVRPQDFGKPSERREQAQQELWICYPEKGAASIEQAANRVSRKRGQRGKYHRKK
jgi:hypothetical protein